LIFLVVCLAICVVCENISADRLFTLHTIPDAQYRKALCNDGTPYGFYFRPGVNNGTTKWVFRLQGGGWCWDIPSCASRWKYSQYWMTSKDLPATMNDTDCIGPACHGGILSSDPKINPYFYDANQVYIWYCSSDSHLGNNAASPQTGNWYFYGKWNILAVMEEIIYNTSLNFANAQWVLITGDSAGGVATLNNIDWMAQYLGIFLLLKQCIEGSSMPVGF